MNTGLHILSTTRPLRLRNIECLYCGRKFSDGVERTIDHVIGRKFVPRGALAKEWNLHAFACKQCNEAKSALESELSAISMQPDALGRPATDDPFILSEAQRKGSVTSTMTGRAIANSRQEITAKSEPFPGVSMSVGLVAPPQVHKGRALRLAGYHISSFFYFLTFRKDTRLGDGLYGSFVGAAIEHKGNWGSVTMRSFMELTAGWPLRFIGLGAREFFKARICRSPLTGNDRPVWAWALEWNRNLRLIGFFGDEGAIKDVARDLSWPKRITIKDTPEEKVAIVPELALAETEDQLFAYPNPGPQQGDEK